MEVYIDVLFAVNFFMDFFILWSVSFIGGIDTGIKKIALASAAGSFLYCAAIYKLKYYMYSNTAACVIILAVITVIAFNPKRIKDFIKNLVFTYIFAMVVGGICYRMYSIYGKSVFSFKILLISSFSVYTVLKFGISYIDRYVVKRRNFINITVHIDGQKIPLTALIDTGCGMKDPLSGENIVVAEIKTVKAYYKGSMTEKRFCTIPFKSLGNENGIVYGIRADYAETGDKKVSPVTLALYNGHFSSGEYDAIVSPDIFKEGDCYKSA